MDAHAARQVMPGELVYVDTFTGLLPAKYIGDGDREYAMSEAVAVCESQRAEDDQVHADELAEDAELRIAEVGQ